MIISGIIVHLSFVDGDGDRTKSVLILEYSDGTVERIVVDKKTISAMKKSISEKADERLREKGVTYGD
jgi:hypothetical protein